MTVGTRASTPQSRSSQASAFMPPTMATHGTPARRQRAATPETTLPWADCPSAWPSPVTHRLQPESA